MAHRRFRGPRWIAAGLAVGALGLAGLLTDNPDAGSDAAATAHSPSPTSQSPSLTATNPTTAQPPAEMAGGDDLPIRGRAPKSGYDRGLFGTAWNDDVSVADGHNGCDTRNDILRRDLVDVTLKPGTHGCVVLTGTLHDPYTGSTIAFQRGRGTSRAVQIDHVVALSDAWQKGAQQWDEFKRRNFANDPRNLQATGGPINEQKSDSDAASWLPPNKSYRCTYVSRIVEVKGAYGLWVTQAEHDAIARVLSNCGATSAPPPAFASLPPPPPPDTSAYYRKCADAKAAGAAPLFAGQPGYRIGLDGDGDGVACEG